MPSPQNNWPRKDIFEIKCSREIFSEEEINILGTYGNQFRRLTSGKRAPVTDAQRRFIKVAQGQCHPETIYEKTWAKYINRVIWEREPANKAAMEERRKLSDDRDDWKKMRGRDWSDMQKRSKGFDD